ncbi:MAG: hypothetical protein WCC21_00575 [Candidatus Acidiferrales bacterium]
MTKQAELRIGLVELKPLKWAPSGWFTNIVTWVTGHDGFRAKVEIIAAELGRYIVEIEDEEPVAQRLKNHAVDEAIEDLIGRATSNPEAVLYGTFHAYPHDDA